MNEILNIPVDSMLTVGFRDAGNCLINQLMNGITAGIITVLSSNSPRLKAILEFVCWAQAVEEVATGIIETMAKPASMDIQSKDRFMDNASRSNMTQNKARKLLPMMPMNESEGRRFNA